MGQQRGDRLERCGVARHSDVAARRAELIEVLPVARHVDPARRRGLVLRFPLRRDQCGAHPLGIGNYRSVLNSRRVRRLRPGAEANFQRCLGRCRPAPSLTDQ